MLEEEYGGWDSGSACTEPGVQFSVGHEPAWSCMPVVLAQEAGRQRFKAILSAIENSRPDWDTGDHD